jgi:acyl carrier protein
MRDKIISILTEIRSEFDFSQNVNFIEQGMLDSFDIVTLVTTLDEEFGISIEGLDIIPESFSTVDSILMLLAKYGME